MTELQTITTGGGISADYTMTLAFSVIGVLLIAISTLVANYFISTLKSIKDEIKNVHERINTREAEHDELIKSLPETYVTKEQQDMKMKLMFHEFDQGPHAEKMADLILLKLKALNK